MEQLTNHELMHFEKSGRLPAEVQAGPFPPACPVCGQRRDRCVCPMLGQACADCCEFAPRCICDLVPAGTPVPPTPPDTAAF